VNRELPVFLLLLAGLVTAWLGQAVLGPPQPKGAPSQLLIPLQVQAAHDDERIHLRLRWPAPRPHPHHDVLRFDGQGWEVLGAGDGDAPLGEDRLAMMLDDGGVPGFDRYGGYMLIGEGIRSMPGAASEQAVTGHPVLGQELGYSDIRKHLPATRDGGWDKPRSAEALEAQRKAGYFIDFWHWRGHRGSGMGTADDMLVADHRHSDSGRSSFATNWDDDLHQPRVMFDPASRGAPALDWAKLAAGELTPEDEPWLTPDNTVAFDPGHPWQRGDTLPRRLLRQAQGSRGDIAARATWSDGHYDLVLSRALDTGNPLEDKALKPGATYNLAFAVHREGASGRHHHVSLPLTLGLERDADLVSSPVQQAGGNGQPDWQQQALEVTLFYPGQITWQRITGSSHGGAAAVRAGMPVRARHDEHQLSLYGLEAEAEIRVRSGWMVNVLLGLMLILAFGFVLHQQIARSPR